MPMDIDFRGRLRKVSAPVSASLNALFEAVANAFDATSALGEKGRIEVRVCHERDTRSLLNSAGDPQYVFAGYEVEDNGVGFTTENLAHFKRSDTTNKPSGKGVGRLLWLHVFDRAKIDSVYEEGGNYWRRAFTFSERYHGVHDAETAQKPAGEDVPIRTVVRLEGPKANREKALVREVVPLAHRLLEHFLPYFAALGGQILTVTDTASGDSRVVNDLFREVIGDRHQAVPFRVRDREFVIHHLLIRPTATRLNTINLCAASRVVRTNCVSEYVPEVGRAATVTVRQPHRYQAYVTGEYLDEITDDERTGLKFPPAPDEPGDDGLPVGGLLYDVLPTEPEGIPERELFAAIAEQIRSHLAEHIDGVRRNKEEMLERFVEHEQPQFRPYVERAKKSLDRLKSRASKKDIEIVLYEAKIEGRAELEEIVQAIIAGSEAHQKVERLRSVLIHQFSSAANAANVSALVEYVATRRAVLRVLAELQQKEGDEDRDNAYENLVHNLFFPQKMTSDDVPAGSQDGPLREVEHLWLIDERLVFHRLLASDLPPSRLRRFLSDSANPPDLVVFDPAFAATDDHGHLGRVTIVEFKRPGRNDYRAAPPHDPILQVIRYAQAIRKGAIEDVNGAKKSVPQSARLHAYIIADLTDTLQERTEDYGFRATPDGRGRYWHHEPTNMMIEIIPWDKLIHDAERRNEAFFRKLDSLPGQR